MTHYRDIRNCFFAIAFQQNHSDLFGNFYLNASHYRWINYIKFSFCSCHPCPAGTCTFKVNNRNTRTRCEICLKLIIKKAERRQWHRSDIFIVNFEHISHDALVFEQVIAALVISLENIPFILFVYNVEKWPTIL